MQVSGQAWRKSLMEFGFSIVRYEEGRGFQDFHPENASDGVKPQREAFHYASFCSILLWDITRGRGLGPSQLALAVWGVMLRSRCDDGVPSSESVGRPLN